MVKIQKRVKRMIATLLATFLVITQVPASINKVEAANKEYPEYLTVGYNQSNPGIAGFFHFDYQIGKNGKPCAESDVYNDPTKHYVIFAFTEDLSAIAYVRCDVFQKQITPPDPDVTTYLVTYENEAGDILGKEFVNKGQTPQKDNIPDVDSNGYWTLKGQENKIEPTNVKISTNTTFVWHEIKEPVTQKYAVSYWDGNKPFFGDNLSKDEFVLGKEYIVRDFEGSHDGSDKHHFIGWLTANGVEKLLNGNGNHVVNDTSLLNKIINDEEFRKPKKITLV